MNSQKNLRISAFTLVELIIVITILAILATIAFVSFQGYVKDARDSSRVSTIKNIQTGIELFFVKTGNAPTPDNSIAITGSSIRQGIIGDSITKMVNLSTIPTDPLNNDNYIYSSTANGKYYQIAIQKENTTSAIFPTTYADGTKSIVIGNYSFDPSLPSLIVVPSSVTASGIFDQNVCFIVNGGSNNLKSCIEPKLNMTMNTLDKNLLGYWDMENYFFKSYNNTANVLFIKDLSGNKYDFVGKISAQNYLTGTTTVSGSIFATGGGIRFDKNIFKHSFYTITTTSGGTNEVDKNIFLENVTASGGNIIPGVTLKIYVNHDILDNSGIKRIFTFSKSNGGNILPGDFLKQIDGNLIRFNGINLESGLATYNDGTSGSMGISGMTGCGDNNGTIDWNDHCSYLQYNIKNTFDGNILFYVVYNFRDKIQTLYQNGKKVYTSSIGIDEIKRMQESGYNKAEFRIGSIGSEPYLGTVYEAGIYSRALSESEIVQQSSILGY